MASVIIVRTTRSCLSCPRFHMHYYSSRPSTGSPSSPRIQAISTASLPRRTSGSRHLFSMFCRASEMCPSMSQIWRSWNVAPFSRASGCPTSHKLRLTVRSFVSPPLVGSRSNKSNTCLRLLEFGLQHHHLRVWIRNITQGLGRRGPDVSDLLAHFTGHRDEYSWTPLVVGIKSSSRGLSSA